MWDLNSRMTHSIAELISIAEWIEMKYVKRKEKCFAKTSPSISLNYLKNDDRFQERNKVQFRCRRERSFPVKITEKQWKHMKRWKWKEKGNENVCQERLLRSSLNLEDEVQDVFHVFVRCFPLPRLASFLQFFFFRNCRARFLMGHWNSRFPPLAERRPETWY